MNKTKRIAIFITLLACSFIFIEKGRAAEELPNFDPNNIITEEEMLDSSSMTLDEIQAFLETRGGYIAYNKFPNAYGEIKRASEIIYEASAQNYDCDGVDMINPYDSNERKQKCVKISLNPKVLIVLLQKEQSLIDDQSPSQNRLDWALGYGCPDNQACNTRWKGFGRQVNSAALQFYDYVKNPQRYSYRAGNTYTVYNTDHPQSIVTPANNATAALYNYTPHVYWGNYNFYKLWMKYFTFNHLNGSLLQARGEAGVWLIDKGKKRAFLSKGALTTRYDTKKIIQVSKADLDRYPTGTPIKFPQYSLVRSPRGTIYLLIDDMKRGFSSSLAFKKLGYNPEEVMNVSWDDLNAYGEGQPITATTSYLTGALIQDKKSGGVFYVYDGTKAPIWDRVLLKTKFKNLTIFQMDPEKLATYKTVEPAIFGDGELLKSTDSSAVFVIADHKKHSFVSGKAFEEIGYKWENILTIPKKILDLYPTGEPIKEQAEETTEEATDADTQNATSTTLTLETGVSSTTQATTTSSSASSSLSVVTE